MARQKKLLALFLVFTTGLFSQSDQQLKSDLIDNILDQYVEDDSPGMAVGIVKEGEIVYEHYVGLANLEHEVRIDKYTRFNIASNAKQYTALGILKLIKEGEIGLEDDFRIYLPNFYPDIRNKITIANLIFHTSGIRDVYYLWSLMGKTWWEMFIDNRDAIALLQDQKDLNFEPGTEYLYSNSNYILLAEIVKQVSGQDFNDFSKILFEELDMPNTSFLTNYMEVIPNKARPYGNWNGWLEYPSITEIHGDGALFTTLQDQLQWEQIIHTNDGQYLSREIIDDSQKRIVYNYGHGLEFENYNGLDYTFHNGSTGAYQAAFLRFPTENMSIVVMANNGSISANNLAWEIALPLLGLEKGSEVYPENPDIVENLEYTQDVLGNYRSEDGTIIRVTEKDGDIYRELYQRDPVKLIPERGGLFEYETIQGLKMNFTNIGKTEQQFTIYISSQKPSVYYKLPDSDMSHFDKSDLDGRFYNDETDTEFTLKFVEDNTYSLTKNGREITAELIVEDYLRTMGSYEINVIRNKENEVLGLSVTNDRIRNVIFDKM